jgi:NADH:ubiquinone oxidoreductase subunit 6 (subunit J)
MNYYRYLAEALYFCFILAIFGGAFVSLRARYLMNSVLGLALALLGMAGLFYHLGSPFLALMQMLINIGAICVIIAFGIMVGPRPEQEAKKRATTKRHRFLAALSCLMVTLLLTVTLVGTRWQPAAARIGDFSLKHLGESLLYKYCMAFELISVVLLAAILGALIVSKIGREEAK